MWDMYRPLGTWGYEPRHAPRRPGPALPEATREWGNLLPEELPEPWSCDWAMWPYTDSWSDLPDLDVVETFQQVLLQDMYGGPALTPAMYVSHAGWWADCAVLFANSMYYLQADECMWKFDGTYASVADFVEHADWNKMEEMEYRPLDEREPEIEEFLKNSYIDSEMLLP
ncbi:hypothetical protein DFH09DRAFT_1418675 [Mycena vulgaris]|nr:hypothetical protein DFH09DRAFT_1418675 [Mycena vulgaris]